MNNGNAVQVLSVRTAPVFIDGHNFTGCDQIVREALQFEMDQITTALGVMTGDGEPAEDRIVFIEKRRNAMTVLELLDGVIHAPADEVVKWPVIINNYILTRDMITVLRQALISWKRFKARQESQVAYVSAMTNYMLYGKAETLARQEAAKASEISEGS